MSNAEIPEYYEISNGFPAKDAKALYELFESLVFVGVDRIPVIGYADGSVYAWTKQGAKPEHIELLKYVALNIGKFPVDIVFTAALYGVSTFLPNKAPYIEIEVDGEKYYLPVYPGSKLLYDKPIDNEKMAKIFSLPGVKFVY